MRSACHAVRWSRITATATTPAGSSPCSCFSRSFTSSTIARAIAYQPRVLLMDEPFAAVDAQTRADLEDLIRSVWRRLGVTLLFVTHDIDEAVYLGQRVIVLSAAPTRVADDLAIDLAADRDQLTTRADTRFTELRSRVYAQIQKVKVGRTAL